MVKNFFIASPLELWNLVVLKRLKVGTSFLFAGPGYFRAICCDVDSPLQTSRPFKLTGIKCSLDRVPTVHVIHVLTSLFRCWVRKICQLGTLPHLIFRLWCPRFAAHSSIDLLPTVVLSLSAGRSERDQKQSCVIRNLSDSVRRFCANGHVD